MAAQEEPPSIYVSLMEIIVILKGMFITVLVKAVTYTSLQVQLIFLRNKYLKMLRI